MRFALLALVSVCSVYAQPRQVTDAEVKRVHRSALIIDTHNDVPMKTVKGFNIGKRSPKEAPIFRGLEQGMSERNSSPRTYPADMPVRTRPPITPAKSSARSAMTS